MLVRSRLSKADPRFAARRIAGAIVLTGLLAGCAVATPAKITSTAGAMAQVGAVQMAPYDADGSLRGAFGTALSQAFATYDVELSQHGATIAEFAIAARDADTGVANPATSTPSAITWESLPRDAHWYDGCAAIRLRATLVLLDRQDGTIAYRGTAESDVCAYNQEDISALADLLVADAL